MSGEEILCEEGVRRVLSTQEGNKFVMEKETEKDGQGSSKTSWRREQVSLVSPRLHRTELLQAQADSELASAVKRSPLPGAQLCVVTGGVCRTLVQATVF